MLKSIVGAATLIGSVLALDFITVQYGMIFW
jgi:hypothetical protein